MAQDDHLTSSGGTEKGGAESPPVLDFDVPQDEVADLRRDPLAYVKKLGIEAETIEIGTIVESYSRAEGWQTNTNPPKPQSYWPGMHCHIIGDKIYCFLN